MGQNEQHSDIKENIYALKFDYNLQNGGKSSEITHVVNSTTICLRIIKFNMLAAGNKVLDWSIKKDLILNKTIKKQWNN